MASSNKKRSTLMWHRLNGYDDRDEEHKGPAADDLPRVFIYCGLYCVESL